MKTLCLVRHAKAESRSLGVSDLERRLVKKGEEDSKAVSRALKKEGFVPDLMISSPAIRAIGTARIFAKTLGYSRKDIILDMNIYSGEYGGLATVVAGLKDKNNVVMLFGHDPSISELAGYLLKDYHGHMSKTGVLCIEFSHERWKEITKGQGLLKYSCSPAEIVEDGL